MIADAQLADKRDTILRMLEVGIVLVHIDCRHADVSVPSKFVDNPDVVLQLSHHFTAPIAHGDEGLSAILQFSAGPFLCKIPWAAITVAFCERSQDIAIWSTTHIPAPRPRLTLLQGGVTEQTDA